MTIDIVIPVFNECRSLELLTDEIQTMADKNSLEPRIIFVDDGSTDASWQTIRKLCETRVSVGGIQLARNYGKSTALAIGFMQAESEFVFTMDADLQDDPEGIPSFLELLEQGADLVCGWKQVRHDNADRKILSRIFNRVVNLSTGMNLHDHNCGLKGFRRSRFEHLRMTRGMHRFTTVMVAASGGNVKEVVVNHRPRRYGRSKYGAGRIIRGFTGLCRVLFATRFARKPVVAQSINLSSDVEISDRAGLEGDSQQPNESI